MTDRILRFVLCALLMLLVASCEKSCTEVEDDTPDDETMYCEVSTDHLDFDSVATGEYKDKSVTIKKQDDMLDDLIIACEYFGFIDPVSGEPSDTLHADHLDFAYNSLTETYDATVTIRFQPRTTGERSCDIIFVTTKDDAIISCPQLTAEGTGVGEDITGCAFNPSYLDFVPLVEVGTSYDATVMLYVVSWPPDNPTIACDDFRFVDPATQQAVATLDFSDPSYPYDFNPTAGLYRTALKIRFAPLTVGTKDCTVNIVKTGEDAYDCPTLSIHGIATEASGHWMWFTPVTSRDLKDVYGNGSRVYACGDMGTVIRHTHGETSFGVWMDEGFDEMPLDAIWVDDPDIVWVGGGTKDGGVTFGKVYRNDDGTTNWIYVDHSWMLDMVTSIWGTGPCDKYYAGPAISGMMPTMYQWDCSDLTGTELGLGYEAITGIHGTDAGNVWAVLDLNLFNVYYYNGSTWTLSREEWMDKALYDVWAAPGGTQAWAVGANGAIYHWTGANWINESIAGETRTIYGVWGFSVIDIYAVGADGLFYHYDGAWEEMPVPGGGFSETLYAVWGLSSPKYIYAVGTNGTTIRYAP